jgi:hypothetical protein
VSPADVSLRLDPDEQQKLAEAAPGTDLSVMAGEDRLPLTSLFVSGETYGCLIAGGYGMWVMFPSRAEDGRLRIAEPALFDRPLELVDGRRLELRQRAHRREHGRGRARGGGLELYGHLRPLRQHELLQGFEAPGVDADADSLHGHRALLSVEVLDAQTVPHVAGWVNAQLARSQLRLGRHPPRSRPSGLFRDP